MDHSCATSGSIGKVPTFDKGRLSYSSELYPAQPGILLEDLPGFIRDDAFATNHSSCVSWYDTGIHLLMANCSVLLACCGFGLSQ